MPNIASALKAEISRIARKTIGEETRALKKTIGPYRSEIAALKKRATALELQLRRLGKTVARKAPVAVETNDDISHRFSAKGLAKNRQRLGLSAKEYGALVGASALSIYKWEKGEVRPRAKYIAAIASVRALGKKDAAARVAQLSEQ